MNWFEGGRRITKLVQIIAVLCGAGYIILIEPDDNLRFEIVTPDGPIQVSHAECDFLRDATESVAENVEVCFRAMQSDVGGYGIPYAKADREGYYRLGSNYSEPVRNYIRKRVSNLTIPPKLRNQAQEEANSRWWREKKQALKDAMASVGIAVFALWIISAVLGWIIRGFAGIPAGMDRRAEAAE